MKVWPRITCKGQWSSRIMKTLKNVSDSIRSSILETFETWHHRFLREFSLVMLSNKRSMKSKDSSRVTCSSNPLLSVQVNFNSLFKMWKTCKSTVWLSLSISHHLIYGEFLTFSLSCIQTCPKEWLVTLEKSRSELFVN